MCVVKSQLRVKRVANLGTTFFYWSLIILGLMVGMNIIITSTHSCVCKFNLACVCLTLCVLRTVLMGGFERANSVMTPAAPTFSEFLSVSRFPLGCS